ncbi:MAG: Permease of the drug/metabolite transporter superfamily [Herbinix sp.]|jgi:drug/metabolite transporter (DMT)-like permease|nr:Permease of the drug/metabolite transporter superfamily [Herbinix sp.]
MIGNKKINIGTIYVLISAICFSLAGVLIKMISWSSLTINGVRNIFAFLIMAIYLKKIGHKLVINRVVILGAACNLLMNLTFVMATKLTSAANAIVLQFTEPIFLILFLWIFWKHKPDRKAVLACIFVFGGILCFFFEQLTLNGQIGNILAILSGILYAMVFLMKKVKDANFESSILLSQFVSFFIFIPAYFKETDATPRNFILVIILGVVQMGLGYVFLAKGLEKVSPVSASLTSTVEPILNPIWTAVFYGELISVIAIIGATIVIISSTAYNISNTDTREVNPKLIE